MYLTLKSLKAQVRHIIQQPIESSSGCDGEAGGLRTRLHCNASRIMHESTLLAKGCAQFLQFHRAHRLSSRREPHANISRSPSPLEMLVVCDICQELHRVSGVLSQLSVARALLFNNSPATVGPAAVAIWQLRSSPNGDQI
jgi:hypothetical protein